MSWAAHNPEKYSEMVNEGIARKLLSGVGRYSKVPMEDLVEKLSELESDATGCILHQALLAESADEIHEVQADHFGNLVDQARDRQE